jgi:hypothetical protein
MRSKSIRRVLTVAVLLSGLGFAVADAAASPIINSAVLYPRIWNDDSNSNLTWGNNWTYPPEQPPPHTIWYNDAELDGDGAGGEWANRHAWRLSDNGTSWATFNNDDGFILSADVTITGPAENEAALEVAQPWANDGGGLTVKTDGEIAAFGGVVPFYSFTVNHGITYTLGETIGLKMIYRPHSLTAGDPGTMEYIVTQASVVYSSGEVDFTTGEHGIIDNNKVGGYCLPRIVVGDPTNWGQAEWANINYVPEPTSLVLFGLMGLAAAWRRRT